MLTVSDYVAMLILGDLEERWPLCMVLQVKSKFVCFCKGVEVAL